MDILLNNPLTNMYGPYFLALYAGVIVFLIIGLLIAKRVVDRSDRLPAPAVPAAVDPFEVAYLRGGANELARAAVFSLRQKGLVEFARDGNKTLVLRTADAASPKLDPVETATLNWIGARRDTNEFFRAGGLAYEIGSIAEQYRVSLERRQFLHGSLEEAAFKPYKIGAVLTILGLGSYKLVAAITHGHYNVGFLIVLAIAGLILALIFGRLPRVTKLGNIYIERLRLAFGTLGKTAGAMPQGLQSGSSSIDPMLLSVGLFGTGILAGTVYSDYNDAFRKAQGSDSCGSSCGSCSSSGCSSGDGGSSCGGGGCGGCGGGGD